MTHCADVLLERITLERESLEKLDDPTVVSYHLLNDEEKKVARKVAEIRINLLKELIADIIG